MIQANTVTVIQLVLLELTRILSKADGLPPRCTWPRIVTRVSYLRRSEISCQNTQPQLFITYIFLLILWWSWFLGTAPAWLWDVHMPCRISIVEYLW